MILPLALLIATSTKAASFTGEFTMHNGVDPATGEVATHYLLPKGWTAKDGVNWDLKNKSRPVNTSGTLTSPDGKTTIAFLPQETQTFQVEGGKLTGMLPPDTASKALDNVLAASHQGLTNANLLVRKDYEIPTPFDTQGLKTKGYVGILEVSFQQNGQLVTELLSCTEYEGSHSGDNGLVQGVWMIVSGYTLTCIGQVTEDAFKTFATVVASFRTDPKFFATTMEVSKRQQAGDVDLKAAVAAVKIDAETKSNYAQNIALHTLSVTKMFPIYPGASEVATYDGSMMSFKGVHIWMKKPNGYIVSDSETSPGAGWEAAKEAG